MRVWLRIQSRGRAFDPGLVPYFCGDWLWNNLYGHSAPFHWFNQEGLLSVTSEKYVHELLVNRLFKLAEEKVWLGEMTVPHDHSCWLGRKTTNQTNKQFFADYQAHGPL